eukprot:1206266-Ditylum_brightwellii.AAC.1
MIAKEVYNLTLSEDIQDSLLIPSEWDHVCCCTVQGGIVSSSRLGSDGNQTPSDFILGTQHYSQ